MASDGLDRVEPVLMSMLRLLAAQTVGGKSLTEKVQVLERAGLERNVIAEVCDTTPGTVRALLSQARKSQTPHRKRPIQGNK